MNTFLLPPALLSLFETDTPDLTHAAKISTVLGLLVSLFLVFYRPFGIEHAFGWKALVVASFGLLGAALFLFNQFIIRSTVRRLLKAHLSPTTRWHRAAWTSWSLLFLIAGIYVYHGLLCGNLSFAPAHLLTMSGRILLVTLLPMLFVASYLHVGQQPKTPAPTSPSLLTLTGNNETDHIALPPAHLLYVEAAGNYARVVYEMAGSKEQRLLRVTLKELEDQLTDTLLMRCHRSFIVNLDRVDHVHGNAQGLTLDLSGSDDRVPVSRSYVRSLKAHLSDVQ